MNRVSYFEIQADDPERAVHFYQHVFAWQFIIAEDLPVPYWRIEGAGPNGGLYQRPASTPPPECGTNAYICSIEVDDIDAISARVIGQGGQLALPKFAVPGVCWHAYFIDPEGNTFGIFQPDAQAR